MLFTAGCAVEEAHWDAARLREHAVNYYADQIMDNLVLAKNGQFFLHVNINNLQSQVISELAGTIQGGQTLNNTGTEVITTTAPTRSTAVTTGPTGATVQTVTTNNIATGIGRVVAGTLSVANTATRLAVRPLTVSATPRRNDQLTFGTVPEINDSPIYEQYLKFLCAEPGEHLPEIDIKDEDRGLRIGNQVKSVAKKQPGETLIECKVDCVPAEELPKGTHYYVSGTLKKWHGDIYYVPIAFRDAYYELCVAIAGRISIGAQAEIPAKTKGLAAPVSTKPYLPPKKESIDSELKIIEQKLNSATPP